MAAGEDTAALVAAMHTLVAGQTVAEWQAVLTAVQQLDHVGGGPVGYWGVSMGCGLGVPFVAAEPRVGAAVLGLLGSPAMAETAARITVPVQFLVQWDDEQVPRAQSLALFDAFGSAEKTLHANPGKHGDMPRFEMVAMKVMVGWLSVSRKLLHRWSSRRWLRVWMLFAWIVSWPLDFDGSSPSRCALPANSSNCPRTLVIIAAGRRSRSACGRCRGRSRRSTR
jgi:hypothetical protein